MPRITTIVCGESALLAAMFSGNPVSLPLSTRMTRGTWSSGSSDAAQARQHKRKKEFVRAKRPKYFNEVVKGDHRGRAQEHTQSITFFSRRNLPYQLTNEMQAML
jgi:hypothetical protein